MSELTSGIQFGLDITDVVGNSSIVKTELDDIGQHFDKFVSRFKNFDKAGTNVIQTFTGLTTEGNKFAMSLSLDKKTNEWKVLSTVITETNRAIANATIASTTAMNTWKAAVIANISSISDPAFQNKASAAVEKIFSIALNTDTSTGRVKSLLGKILGDKDVGELSGPAEQQITAALRQYKTIIDKKGSEILAESAVKMQKAAATRVSQSVQKVFADIVNDPNFAAQAKKLTSKLASYVESGQFVKGTLTKTLNETLANPNVSYHNERDQIAQTVNQLLKLQNTRAEGLIAERRNAATEKQILRDVLQVERDKISEEDRLELLRTQRLQAALLARSSLLATFGATVQPMSANERLKFDSATKTAVAPVASGQIGLNQFQQALGSVQTGIPLNNLDAGVKATVAGIMQVSAVSKTAGNDAAAALTKLQKGFVDTSYEGKKAASGILLNWQSMIRLLEVQVFHILVSRIIGGLRQAAIEATDFQKHISEIRTITQSEEFTFEQASQGIAVVAQNTGFALKDITEAIYETTSNQMAKGNEAIAHVAQVGQFARATVSSMADSISLIDGVLNSYQMSVSQTTNVSAQLFKTIDLGRLRAQDIANSYGNLTSISSELGVSLEETNAAMARLTIQGIKPAVAMTLLENLMSKLIKPTGEMSKILHGWGFETGQAAIAALGFSGVLRKISMETAGNLQEIAKMFNTLRGFRGILALTNDLDAYALAVRQIRDAYLESMEAQKRAIESPGSVLSRELEKIHSFVTTSFGQGILTFFGAINTNIVSISGAVQFLLPNLIKLGAAAAIYFAYTKLATGSTVTTTKDHVDTVKFNGLFPNIRNDAELRVRALRSQYVDLRSEIEATGNAVIRNQNGSHQITANQFSSPLARQQVKDYLVQLTTLDTQARTITGKIGTAFSAMGTTVARGISRLIGSIDWVSLGITAGVLLIANYYQFQEKLKTMRDQITAEVTVSYAKDTQDFVAAETAKLNILDTTVKTRFSGILNFLAQQNIAYDKAVETFGEIRNKLHDDFSASIKTVMEGLQNNLTEIKNTITSTAAKIKEISKSLADRAIANDREKFDNTLNAAQDPAAKMQLIQERIDNLTAQAAATNAGLAETEAKRLLARGETDPVKKAQLLEELKNLEEKYNFDSGRQQIIEAIDLHETLQKLATKALKEKDDLEKKLAKARTDEANLVIAAKMQKEIDDDKDALNKSDQTHKSNIQQQKDAAKAIIRIKQEVLDTFKANNIDEAKTNQIADLLKAMKSNELSLKLLADWGLDGPKGINASITRMENIFKDFSNAEKERLKARETALKAEAAKAVETIEKTENTLKQLAEFKTTDSKGEFTANVLKQYNLKTSEDLQIAAKMLNMSVPEATVALPKEAGQVVEDAMRKIGEETLELITDQTARAEFQKQMEATILATRLGTEQQVFQILRKLYTSGITETKDAIIKKNAELETALTGNLTDQQKFMSQSTADLGTITARLGGSIKNILPDFAALDVPAAAQPQSVQDAVKAYRNNIPGGEGMLTQELEKYGLIKNFSKGGDAIGMTITGLSKKFKELTDQQKTAMNDVNATFTQETKVKKAEQDLETLRKRLEEKKIPVTAFQISRAETDVETARKGLAEAKVRSDAARPALEQNIKDIIAFDEGIRPMLQKLGATPLEITNLKSNMESAVTAGTRALAAQDDRDARTKTVEKSMEALNAFDKFIVDSGDAAKKSTIDLKTWVDGVNAMGPALKESLDKMKGLVPPPVPHAFGGMIGSDSVAAMLTPGEFVMNRAATRSFFPLISAMNANGSMAQGGTVSMGDVNINLTGTGYSGVDARAIARELQTLSRQGIV